MLHYYLVAGLGVSGYSVVKYLVKKGEQVVVTDSHTNPPQLTQLQNNFPNIKSFLGRLEVPDYITHIILSPGISLNTPEIISARNRGVKVLGDIELFAQVANKPVIAITGSNGKSTTTALMGAMAQACGIQAGVGGNLGQPALSLLGPEQECYILELSSFQLETTYSLQCLAATVLNISPDHMDRYATIKDYTEAKLSIYNHAKAIVVNRDDLATWPAQKFNGKVISFGLDCPTDSNYGVRVENGISWLARGAQMLMPVPEMTMLGKHNVANALAALALGEIAGFSMDAMLRTLRNFAGLEHRCEKVLVAQDILWVNDSKGTNVGATLMALAGLSTAISGRWIIILGGVGKNADFTPLLEPITKWCSAAILIGTDAPLLLDLLQDALPCFMAKDLLEAVLIAKEEAVAGDGVLLSPACASLDMFKNYVARGEMFKHIVLQEIGSSTAYASAKAT